jgi:ribosome-associated heat shock protein Hsp15
MNDKFEDNSPVEADSIRIDKWLKIARFFKQREEAAVAVENGRVRLNGNRIKPSKTVKAGDELTIKIDNSYRKCLVKGISQRSISKELARELYEMEEPLIVEGEKSEIIKILDEQDNANRKLMKGKPNKKERRILNKYKYGQS